MSVRVRGEARARRAHVSPNGHADSRAHASPMGLRTLEHMSPPMGMRTLEHMLPRWACGLSSTCFPDGPAEHSSRAHAEESLREHAHAVWHSLRAHAGWSELTHARGEAGEERRVRHGRAEAAVSSVTLLCRGAARGAGCRRRGGFGGASYPPLACRACRCSRTALRLVANAAVARRWRAGSAVRL